MDNKKKIEIPFGAFDSELIRQEINIPNGFKAVINGNKIILTRVESEDEKIRKAIHIYLDWLDGHKDYQPKGDYTIKDMIAWLEKQGEQKVNYTTLAETGNGGINALVTGELSNSCDYEEKPVGKVEPKFKVGDWITNGLSSPMQISSIDDGIYYTHNDTVGGDIESMDKEYHLWTIRDARDGDVLYCENSGIEYIVMNKGISKCNNIDSYFRYNSEDGFDIGVPSVLSAEEDIITPATKEQRELLFQKMREAGYEWDSEKKELREIEQEPDWSEEDEKMINKLMAVVELYYVIDDDLDKQSCLSWLKSLKQRTEE